MKIQKVYDRKYNGRRIIVMWHSFSEEIPEEFKNDFSSWYCGYMEILAADKDYKDVEDVRNGATGDDLVYELYPSAIGGVTWTGAFPVEGVDDINNYVGFDTNHFGTDKLTLKDVVKALHDMVDKDQAAINGGKQ